MKQKFALLSPQGTACWEACLCAGCATPEARSKIECDVAFVGLDAPVPGTWTDCSDNAPRKVWVAIYTHKHGTDVSVHISDEAAEAARQELAAQAWDGFMDEDAPADPKAMADHYFERCNELGDEFFEVEECTVEGAPPAPAVPYPDAADLRSALQWLLDDMADTGETHTKEGKMFDSVEGAARALINAGGVLPWYPGDELRIPVVDGDQNADVYGYASTPMEAKIAASRKFADKVVRVDRLGPIRLRNGGVLPEAFVALTATMLVEAVKADELAQLEGHDK